MLLAGAGPNIAGAVCRWPDADCDGLMCATGQRGFPGGRASGATADLTAG